MTHIISKEQAISQFAPTWQNNSRQIARETLNWAEKHPSDRAFNKAEYMTGLSADHDDKDWGNGPRGDNE